MQDDYGRWYMIHLAIQVFGLILLIAAISIPLTANDPIPRSLRHYQLGIAVFILAMLQPFSAIPRFMTHHVRTLGMSIALPLCSMPHSVSLIISMALDEQLPWLFVELQCLSIRLTGCLALHGNRYPVAIAAGADVIVCVMLHSRSDGMTSCLPGS